ncbi:uncharacterized protein EKO05_0009066 [Ascochyta rabiei]|uniref:Transporter n=1 Tax=Didymella rabiei TaxID=5454 RepID=A0A163IP46_DIDRA|nr:uncharacterized protein EKO05_0009066 [Ascochyta rabiei]KZM25858.1 transporter [Ascochyta rabiei]UPX18775.1 hypothetical protein EKO05_0009066 [Ascochyta rabiei]
MVSEEKPPSRPASLDIEQPAVTTETENLAEDRLEKLSRVYGCTWDGPDDPEDPYNWSSFHKIMIGTIFSFGQLVTLMSASMIASALGEIAHDLDTTASTGQIILSTYFLGLAFGPFLAAALAEMYGRRPIWIFGNAWYILWNAICPVGNSTGLMIFGRLMTGVGASVGITLTGPVMADLYREKDRGKSLAIASLLPYLGPALGPIVGGIVTQLVKWTWVFWIMSLFNTAVTIVGIIYIRETYTPVLLRRKAAAQSNAAPPTIVPGSILGVWKDFASRLSGHLMRPLRLLFTRPIIQFIALVLALNFGVYCFMLSTFASLWINKYNQSELASSLHYISIAIGSTIAGQAGGHLMDFVYNKLSKRNGGQGKPEFRVPYLVPGLILMPAGLFWYGWSAQYTISWVMVDFGAAILTLGSFVSAQAMYAYQLDEFAEFGASANAASRMFSAVMGFAFPIFAPQLYEALGYGWGNSLLAFIMIAIGFPIPIILWFWGQKLRALGKKD